MMIYHRPYTPGAGRKSYTNQVLFDNLNGEKTINTVYLNVPSSPRGNIPPLISSSHPWRPRQNNSGHRLDQSKLRTVWLHEFLRWPINPRRSAPLDVLARRAAFVCVRTIARALVHGKGKYLGSTPVPAQRRARPSYEAVA